MLICEDWSAWHCRYIQLKLGVHSRLEAEENKGLCKTRVEVALLPLHIRPEIQSKLSDALGCSGRILEALSCFEVRGLGGLSAAQSARRSLRAGKPLPSEKGTA